MVQHPDESMRIVADETWNALNQEPRHEAGVLEGVSRTIRRRSYHFRENWKVAVGWVGVV